MNLKRIVVLFVISMLISGNAYASINNYTTVNSVSAWINTDAGREYAGAGITTYYVGNDATQPSDLLLMPDISSMQNNIASTGNPVFTITSQIKINDVNVGENAVRIKENGNLKCLFNVKNNTNEQRKITVALTTKNKGGFEI